MVLSQRKLLVIEITYRYHTFRAIFVDVCQKMYFSFGIDVQTQSHTSVDLSFICMRYGHLYGNAQWPCSSLPLSSVSRLHTVETNQWTSTEGAQIRLFKWIGHYTGDAWGYQGKKIQSHAISQHSCIPAIISSTFVLPCLLEFIFSHLKKLANHLGEKINPAPKSFPWKSLWLQFSNHWSDPTCEWVWHCEQKYMGKGNKSKGEGQKQKKAAWVEVKV